MKSFSRLTVLLLVAPSCISAFTTPKTFNPSAIVPSTPSHRVSVVDRSAVAYPKNKLGYCSTRTQSSSTALAAAPLALAAAGAGIVRFYKAFPLIAAFLTCGTKACVADSLAQYRDVCTTKFDAKRNFAMIMYSGLILGISAEFMYNHLFPMMFGVGGAERNILLAVKMTLFDGFINAPFFWLPPAYIAKALVYQYPIREGIQKYIADVKENGLLKKYWSLWLPMTMINFVFMPAHFRIAFAAGVSFFWMIILSIVANNEEQDPDSCPVEPERGMAFPRALD